MKPILFTVGPFHVFAFGFFLSLAFLFSTFIVWKYGKEELKEEELLDAFIYTSLASLLSARVFYIIFHFTEFGYNILKYVVFREAPGLSFVGGVIGGSFFLYYWAKKKKMNFAKTADIFSLAACLALSLGSLGEFLGGSTNGVETHNFWGVRIAGLSGVRHPVELYQSFILFVLFILLSFIYNKHLQKKTDGLLALLFIFISSVIISVLEFLKTGPLYLYNRLSLNQAAAIGFMLITVYPLIKKFKEIHGRGYKK